MNGIIVEAEIENIVDTVISDLQCKLTANCKQSERKVSTYKKSWKDKVLALGAQMEPGFCLTAEGQFFPAEIPGDISSVKNSSPRFQRSESLSRLMC